MIVVLQPNISKKDERAVLKEITKLGYRPHVMRGVEHTVIGAIGDERTHQSLEVLATWPQVQRVMPVQKRYKLVSRQAHQSNSRITVGDSVIGGRKFHVMAGPCSVEDEKQLLTTAHAVKAAGATFLRGGAFKPRTSPYEFQGLGQKGLKLLAKARRETGLAIITELLSEQQADLVAEYTDIIQIGARNSQNFQLLIAAARTGKPVLLKRGLSMRIEEWLLAGEYVLSNDNPNLIFCERGIRTFETYTRNTLDLSTIRSSRTSRIVRSSSIPARSWPRRPCRLALPRRRRHGSRWSARGSASQPRRSLERRRPATYPRRLRQIDARPQTLPRCRRPRMIAAPPRPTRSRQ